ncbi:MAG: SUMF1/EgtB/PvdO family nonheme iron enzyme, partial [Pseudomonadota bacterium]|nr:SUMF1/EgtB/PvdO family nonheme iron enzyme [Pseudomonadota bacterium]
MARAAAARPSAAEICAALEAWLAGAQRMAHARAALAEAAERVPAVDAAREAADAARRAWLARDVQSADRAADPAHWTDDDAAVALDVHATFLEEEAVRALRGALAEAPELPEAREQLAERLLAALHVAEDHADADAARAIAEELREQVAAVPSARPGRARLDAALAGDGTVSLVTDPPGAEVLLARFEERGRRMVAVPSGTLGTTPLRDAPLGMGSWMLTVRAPGCADVRLPVVVRRGERWARVAPGETAPRTLRLPRLGELGPDDCYVPAGRFVRRHPGDAAVPTLWGWNEAFVIRRFAVTHGEYLPFLDALLAAGRREEALARAPRMPPGTPIVGYALEGDRFVLVPDEEGDTWQPALPAFLLSPSDAVAYAGWLGARTGLPWRLPTEIEWVHAARGADGRRYPMGEHLDPAWAQMRGTYPTPAFLEPVGTFPTDESPFGVRDLMGGVYDFVADPGPDGPTFAWHGGCWVSAASIHSFDRPRRAVPAHRRGWSNGFRLARSAP